MASARSSLRPGLSQIAFDRTQTSLDPLAYDGTVTYSFEIVATNSDTSAHTVLLLDSSGNSKGSISVPGSTTLPTRLRADFTPNATEDIYRLALDATPLEDQLQVLSSRMLVRQTGASRTKLYIPLLSSSALPSRADVTAPIESTSSGYYSMLPSASIYVRDTSVLSQLSQYNPWELETLVASTDGAIGAVALFDVTRGALVEDTETLFASDSVTITRSPLDDGVVNFGPDNEMDQYQITLSCWLNCSGTVSLYKAGLWVSLGPLDKIETIYRLALGASAVPASLDLDSERSLIDLSRFSNPTVLFQAVGSADVAGPAEISLLDAGTDDAGSSGHSTVAGSSLTFISTTKNWMRSSAPVAITSGNRYLVNVNPSAGNAVLTDSAIVIDSTR